MGALLLSYSVTYPSMHMMLHWKEKDAVKIFNDQLAEFDIVNIEMSTENFTYVSGTVRHHLGPLRDCPLAQGRDEGESSP